MSFKKTLNTTKEYNDDHANYNYISFFWLCFVFAVFHFKTSLHLIKDNSISACLFNRKPEID